MYVCMYRRSHRTGRRFVGDYDRNPGVAVGSLEAVEEANWPLGLSSNAVGLSKRQISALHTCSIMAFSMSPSLDSQSLPFSNADPFIVLQIKSNGVILVILSLWPTTFRRIGNSAGFFCRVP